MEIVKEQYTSEGYLLEQVTQRIQDGQYPVIVTAGDGRQKLAHIRHNRYLENSYEALSTINGSLVTFGFNFGPQDTHIIKAINLAAKQPPNARLRSIYLGVYSEADRERIEDLAGRFKCKVHIFDSRTVHLSRLGILSRVTSRKSQAVLGALSFWKPSSSNAKCAEPLRDSNF